MKTLAKLLILVATTMLIGAPALGAPTFFWRCESTTLDGTHDYSAGGTTATGSSSAAINATAARVGTNGVQAPTASDYYSITATGLYGTTGSAAFSLYVAGGSWVADAVPFILDGTGGAGTGNDRIRVTTAAGGNLSLQLGRDGWGNQAITTTGNALSVGNWYGIVIRWSATNADYRLEVYNASGTLIDSVENLSADSSLFPQTANIDRLHVGEVWGATLNNYVDNVFVADAYDEPLQSNLTISSYTSYSGGGGALPTITDAEDEAFYGGELSVTLTGSNFGSTQGAGRVVISPTDDIDNVSAVEQTVTSWSASSIEFTVVRSSLSLNTNLYLFVEENGGNSNAAGYVVQITGDKKIKLLLNSASVGATVDGVVFEAPVSGIVGPEVCEFTGQTVAAGSGGDAGKGVLKVVTATFGCNALALGAAPLVYVKNATNFTPIWAATVIAE